jgi:hypothetical protein
MAGVLCGPAEARKGDVLKRSWHTLLSEFSRLMKCTFHLFPEPCLARASRAPRFAFSSNGTLQGEPFLRPPKKGRLTGNDQDARDMMQICAVGNPSEWCPKNYCAARKPHPFSHRFGGRKGSDTRDVMSVERNSPGRISHNRGGDTVISRHSGASKPLSATQLELDLS